MASPYGSYNPKQYMNFMEPLDYSGDYSGGFNPVSFNPSQMFNFGQGSSSGSGMGLDTGAGVLPDLGDYGVSPGPQQSWLASLGNIGGKVGATTNWLGNNSNAIGAVTGGIKSLFDAYTSIKGLGLAKKQMGLMRDQFAFNKQAIQQAAAQQGEDLIRTRSAVEGRPVTDYEQLRRNTTLR